MSDLQFRSDWGIQRKTLALVLGVLVCFFAVTSALATWYRHERVKRAQAYFQIGLELERHGHDEQALESYKDALSLSRDGREYRVAVASTLMKLGRLHDAAVWFHEVLKTAPGDGISNMMLARIAAKEGHTAAAVEYYHMAIFGDWPNKAAQRRIEARWELIDFLVKEGLAKSLVPELLELSDQVPSDLSARKRIAHLLLTYDSPMQAAEVFRDIVSRQRSDAEAYAGLGEAELVLGDYAGAQHAFREALRLDPNDPAARGSLDLISEVRKLDPSLPNLSTTERYRRTTLLLERNASRLKNCLASRKMESPGSAQQVLDDAHRSAARSGKRKVSSEAIDANISLAERLWRARNRICGPTVGTDRPLSMLMRHLSP